MILMSETLHDSHVLSRLGFVPQQASSHWVSALQWPPLVALQQCAVPCGSTTESLRMKIGIHMLRVQTRTYKNHSDRTVISSIYWPTSFPRDCMSSENHCRNNQNSRTQPTIDSREVSCCMQRTSECQQKNLRNF